ncbi:hypothetical protein LTR24_001658 [Lithohypha guttulata]|uniref:BTB domain-containing protein n=1 Tax=Lithohypha guttulata TaxID=1690604 RepID=A0ABR0KLZ3_9EURO|nr:hypothetical protein LTR24_001658 [Lithohypha guttulata]
MDLLSIDYDATITIVLEDTSARFTVYKDLICAHSPFIKGCLQTGFKEAKEQIVTIRDWQNSHTWTYQGRSALRTSEIALNSAEDKGKEAASDLVELYVLADRFLMSNLKNEIVQLYCLFHVYGESKPDHYSLRLHHDALRTLAQHGLQDCTLRKCIASDIASTHARWIEDVAQGVGNLAVRLKGLELLQEIFSDCPEIAVGVLQKSIVNMKRGMI